MNWEQYTHLQRKANRISVQAPYARLLNIQEGNQIKLAITKIVATNRMFLGEIERKVVSGLEITIPKDFVTKHSLSSNDQLVIEFIPV